MSAPDPNKLYEIAIAEYRFQVQLNWDRTKHYFVYNGALIAAAGAIFKLGESEAVDIVVACLLGLAFFNSAAGVRAIKKGHEYYERDRARMAELEKVLTLDQPLREGGASVAMMKTAGMRAEHGEEDLKRGWFATITNQQIALQVLMALLSFAGSAAAIAHACHAF